MVWTVVAKSVVKLIVKQNAKKQALRLVQREVGVNKFMSLVRRFDKKKTFVTNFKKAPAKMVVKMGKQFAKRKILRQIPLVRQAMNWRKYGIKECMKRFAFKMLPTEAKAPYYFIKGVKNRYQKVQLFTLGKKTFWNELNNMSNKQKARVLDEVIKLDPDKKELREYWTEVLDKDIVFVANSPQTQNFAQLHITYNIAKEKLWLPIRGYGGTQIKTYIFENVPWGLIKLAMMGKDFGATIYSAIRTPTADYYGKFWAPRDPYYKK